MRNTSIAPIAVVPPGKTIYVQIIYFYIIYVRERFTTGRGKIKEKKNVKKKKRKTYGEIPRLFFTSSSLKTVWQIYPERRESASRVSHNRVTKRFRVRIENLQSLNNCIFYVREYYAIGFCSYNGIFFSFFFFSTILSRGTKRLRNVRSTCVPNGQSSFPKSILRPRGRVRDYIIYYG